MLKQKSKIVEAAITDIRNSTQAEKSAMINNVMNYVKVYDQIEARLIRDKEIPPCGLSEFLRNKESYTNYPAYSKVNR